MVTWSVSDPRWTGVVNLVTWPRPSARASLGPGVELDHTGSMVKLGVFLGISVMFSRIYRDLDQLVLSEHFGANVAKTSG